MSRNTDLAKIHIAKKQLGLDEDIYRDMLWTIARVKSSADLDEHGRKAVIDHLRQCGASFDRSRRGGRRPHNYNQLPAYIEKIGALLADMGLPWSYAEKIAYNITGGKSTDHPGVKKLAWIKEDKHWRDIIAALSVEQEKRRLLTRVDKQLEQLGKDRNDIDTWLNRSNWTRQRATLRKIITRLNNELGEQV